MSQRWANQVAFTRLRMGMWLRRLACRVDEHTPVLFEDEGVIFVLCENCGKELPSWAVYEVDDD